jgi:hypothetical protein
MMQYLSHLSYTIIHKYFVFVECCKRGIIWRGIMHDISKFSPSEFGAYANYFFNSDGERKDHPENGPTYQVEAFKRAWCHHAHSNDHHYNYWIVDAYGSCNKEPLLPPADAIKEMAADMIGASAAQGYPPNGAKDYYLKHRDRIILHPVARSLLEKELVIK